MRCAEPPRRDIYLLPASPHRRIDSLVKLRDGCILEIKLWRRNAGRLQYWQPGMRAGFPLPARAQDALGRALAVRPPRGESAADLRAGLEAGPVRLVTVFKRRLLFRRAGSSVEVSRLTIGDHSRFSVALDDPDPHRAAATVARLALHRQANLHYGAALPALCDAPPDGPSGPAAVETRGHTPTESEVLQ